MDKRNRLEKSLVIDYLKDFEYLSLGKTDIRSYFERQMKRTERLCELDPENPYYHLMEAAVLIRAGKKEVGEGLLKKYEWNHKLQLRDPEFRAGFLYLAEKLSDDGMQRKNILMQLQKLYQKNPTQKSLYWYMASLDDGFTAQPEKKLAFLEKQWKQGQKQNLLYLEAVKTLREYPESIQSMSDFLIQCYLWAYRRNAVTKEMAVQLGRNVKKFRKYDKKYEYLLRSCYRTFATKELLTALCSLYIREGRIDTAAADYYEMGIQYELKLNNLYEYYMMSTLEKNNCLLQEPVLLYFLYHDTLTVEQKVYLYKNILTYADPESEIYGKYMEPIKKYTMDSLLKRRISPEYAFLYNHVLYPQIFTKEMAEAMTDLLFLRRVVCMDARIREVEVYYEQLRKPQKQAFKRQEAYVPIYSPTAVLTLIDSQGNLYRNTVSYQVEKLLDEKRYAEVCAQYVKNHPGLLLYFCGKNPEHLDIAEDNLKFYMQIPETEGFSDTYRNGVVLKLLEFQSRSAEEMPVPESWWNLHVPSLGREQRGKLITYLANHGHYEQAYALLETYGAVYVSAGIILQILTALYDRFAEEEGAYYRLCYGCFKNGQKNEISLKYLTEKFLGTCVQMAEVWKQARAYGVNTHQLEERILSQMMFTGTELAEHFEIFLSYQQMTPDDIVKRAYFTYQSRKAFLGQGELDDRFYFLLEEELFTRHGYAEICFLAYLKYLSKKEEFSSRQKNAAAIYLKNFFSKNYYFEFMKEFGKIIPEALVLEDKVFVEYHAPASSEVILNYRIEKNGQEASQYVTGKLYPVCEGIYSRSFTLFEGDKLSYFITEKKEDGTETTAPVMIKEQKMSFTDSRSRYGRLNRLRNLKAQGKEQQLEEALQQYRFLELAVEQLFTMK